MRRGYCVMWMVVVCWMSVMTVRGQQLQQPAARESAAVPTLKPEPLGARSTVRDWPTRRLWRCAAQWTDKVSVVECVRIVEPEE
jgi:hypothetical protein